MHSQINLGKQQHSFHQVTSWNHQDINLGGRNLNHKLAFISSFKFVEDMLLELKKTRRAKRKSIYGCIVTNKSFQHRHTNIPYTCTIIV